MSVTAPGLPILILDGAIWGHVKSMEGGGITAQVIQESGSTGFYTKKRIRSVSTEDLILKVDLFQANKALCNWIAEAWKGESSSKNCTVVITDPDSGTRSSWEYDAARIVETTFPGCDGNSKEPALFTIKLSTESTRFGKARTSPLLRTVVPQQAPWYPTHFRLEIPGIDCRQVARIDPFTVKQIGTLTAKDPMTGVPREIGQVDFPNLHVEVARPSAQPFLDWFEDFVVRGNNREGSEKQGKLAFLKPDMQEEHAHINLRNLGIYRHTLPAREPYDDSMMKWENFGLYCERLELVAT